MTRGGFAVGMTITQIESERLVAMVDQVQVNYQHAMEYHHRMLWSESADAISRAAEWAAELRVAIANLAR